MTTRNDRDIARRDALRAEARALDARLTALVRADYPGLCQWALRCPIGIRMIRTGTGQDDWRWGAYRSAAQEVAALRRYLRRAPALAASRISEAYGLGSGAEWAARNGIDLSGDAGVVAGAQVLASLAAVRR